MPTMSKPLRFQNVQDVALEHTGTAGSVFAFALANGISITDDLDVLGEYEGFGANARRDEDVLAFIAQYNVVHESGYHSASQWTDEEAMNWTLDDDCINGGIGCWAIGIDFEIGG